MNIHERHTPDTLRHKDKLGQTGTDWDSKNKWSWTMNHKKNLLTIRRSIYRHTGTPHLLRTDDCHVTISRNPQTKTVITSARPNSGKDQRTQTPYLGPSHLWGKVLWGQINQTPPFNVDQGEITYDLRNLCIYGMCSGGTGGCPCTSIITTSGSFEASLR